MYNLTQIEKKENYSIIIKVFIFPPTLWKNNNRIFYSQKKKKKEKQLTSLAVAKTSKKFKCIKKLRLMIFCFKINAKLPKKPGSPKKKKKIKFFEFHVFFVNLCYYYYFNHVTMWCKDNMQIFYLNTIKQFRWYNGLRMTLGLYKIMNSIEKKR